MTVRLGIDPDHLDAAIIERAANVLLSGGLVAFPTETVYGLGCLAEDQVAVQRVFDAKGRPGDDPLIVHVSGVDSLTGLIGEVSPLFWSLAHAHWPGPLTLVVARGPRIPPLVTSGLDTVAVRAPAHPVAIELLAAVDAPIAAPSANRFGHISPTSAAHVLDDLDGRCDLVLDAGDTVLGLESTVVRVELDHVVVLRHGALAVEDLDVPVREGSVRPSSSPGLAVRHYSPHAEMFVIEPGGGVLPAGGGVYLGYHDSAAPLPEGWRLELLGDRSDLGVVGARLYRVLRRIDAGRPGMIVAELTGRGGLGRAIDDRLIRAASGRALGD